MTSCSRTHNLSPPSHRSNQVTHFDQTPGRYDTRADSTFAPSQWEATLHCNDISHWLGASLETTLCVRKWLFNHKFYTHLVEGCYVCVVSWALICNHTHSDKMTRIYLYRLVYKKWTNTLRWTAWQVFYFYILTRCDHPSQILCWLHPVKPV